MRTAPRLLRSPPLRDRNAARSPVRGRHLADDDADGVRWRIQRAHDGLVKLADQRADPGRRAALDQCYLDEWHVSLPAMIGSLPLTPARGGQGAQCATKPR